MNRMFSLAVIWPAFALALGVSSAALAQTTTPSPLKVEPIPTQLVVAPDYKVTDLDGDFAQLAGIYAGRLIDDTLFVGAAAYWLADGPDGASMTYGGVLIGWTSPEAGRIRFGARALTGIGTARLPVDLTPRLPPDIAPLAVRFGGRGSGPLQPVPRQMRTLEPGRLVGFGGGSGSALVRPIRVRVADDYFVFEPQATLGLALFDHVTVNAAAGYRATALTDALRDRLHGATGSLGVEFDW